MPFAESIEVFWRSLGRGTKKRARSSMLKTHCICLSVPSVLAFGDLWTWKALSGCYYVGFPFPLVLKNVATFLVWGTFLIFRIL